MNVLLWLLTFLLPANPECLRAIADMGSADWEVRTAASHRAAQLSRRCFQQLALAAAGHADTEVRRRCRDITEAYERDALAQLGPMPWITTYTAGDARIPVQHAEYLAREMQGSTWSEPPFVPYTDATRHYCRDQVRLRLWLALSMEPLKAEVQQMREAEAAWRSQAESPRQKLGSP